MPVEIETVGTAGTYSSTARLPCSVLSCSLYQSQRRSRQGSAPTAVAADQEEAHSSDGAAVCCTHRVMGLPTISERIRASSLPYLSWIHSAANAFGVPTTSAWSVIPACQVFRSQVSKAWLPI